MDPDRTDARHEQAGSQKAVRPKTPRNVTTRVVGYESAHRQPWLSPHELRPQLDTISEVEGTAQRRRRRVMPTADEIGDVLALDELVRTVVVVARRAHEHHRSSETASALAVALLAAEEARNMRRTVKPPPHVHVGPLSYWN